MILDSFLLNAPSTDEQDDMIPETTWKSIIESTFDISFHNFLKMDQELMISSGIQDELLRLDENSVSFYFILFNLIKHVLIVTQEIQVWCFIN